MIEPILRSLADSQYRWLIVISVTCGLGLVLLLPLVDDYFAEHEEKIELAEELKNARLAAEGLTALEALESEEVQQLELLKHRTVSEESINAYRSRLVDLARQTQCQIRRINVGNVRTRPWKADNDPLADRVEPKRGGAETGLELRRQPISLSVSGSMSNLQSMLEAMYKDQMLVHTKSMEIRPTGQNRKTVTLDMELWFFDLEPTSNPT